MGGLQFFCTSVDQPEALNFNSNFDMNTTVNRLRPFSGHWTLSVLISWLIVLHHIQNMASFCIASKGDVELLEKCVEAMNAKSDPSEEEINSLNRQKNPSTILIHVISINFLENANIVAISCHIIISICHICTTAQDHDSGTTVDGPDTAWDQH